MEEETINPDIVSTETTQANPITLENNFPLSELVRSPTATAYKIKEQFNPSADVVRNLEVLRVGILEPIRKTFCPYVPQSVYRSPALNRHPKVNGSLKSYHLFGMAADINLSNKKDWEGKRITNKALFTYILYNLPYTELIWEYGTTNEPLWVHVAYDKNSKLRQVKRVYEGKDGVVTEVLTKERAEALTK